jgi:hypothetical protein
MDLRERVWTGFSWFRIGAKGEPLGTRNGTLGFMKAGNFSPTTDFIRKDPAPWSQINISFPFAVYICH